MAKNASDKNYFHYRMTHPGANYSVKDFWQPGEPLSKEDQKLLENVKRFYQKRGYPPCRADLSMQYVSRLKTRFRTWKNVILAADLPALNSPEVQRKKQGMQSG